MVTKLVERLVLKTLKPRSTFGIRVSRTRSWV